MRCRLRLHEDTARSAYLAGQPESVAVVERNDLWQTAPRPKGRLTAMPADIATSASDALRLAEVARQAY